MDERQIHALTAKGKYKEIADSPESRKLWRELYTLPNLEAKLPAGGPPDERHQRYLAWEQKRYDEAMAAKYSEGGRPLAWHLAVLCQDPHDHLSEQEIRAKDGLKTASDDLLTFLQDPRWNWFRKMYDRVFLEKEPDGVTEKANEDEELKEGRARQRIVLHRRIWDNITSVKASAKNRPTKPAYRDLPQPVLALEPKKPLRWYITEPLTHRTIALHAEVAREFTAFGSSGFDCSLEEYHAIDRIHKAKRLVKGWGEHAEGDTCPWISFLPTQPAFSASFFNMRLDEDEEEGVLFLPSKDRALGKAKAALVYDKRAKTFFLQKVKQRRAATEVWGRVKVREPEGTWELKRAKVLRPDKKREDAKLPLFGLPLLNKKEKSVFLELWDALLKHTQHLRALRRSRGRRKYTSEDYFKVVALKKNTALRKERFLNLAFKFCESKARQCLTYNTAVPFGLSPKERYEQAPKLLHIPSNVEVSPEYVKWVSRAYALLMAGAQGTTDKLGWPATRNWELYQAPSSDEKYWEQDQSEEKQWLQEQEERTTETKRVSARDFSLETTHYTHCTVRRRLKVEEED